MYGLYRILRLFFTPKCKHQFKLIDTQTVRTKWMHSEDTLRICNTLQCELCGDIEYRKTRG